MSRPLLAVDGDSFAHRAYHGLPKSISRSGGRPGNALVGFTNMLLRLWQAERPRAVVIGWDTLTVPTYRHEAMAGYQAGREFDAALLEQLDLLPMLASATGIACGKAPGYEADDFLAAAVAAERERGGSVLVATSDRDAFQLVGPDVTILQPIRGVSSLARIRPDEVVERYGVDPEQVTDFIALRGDPSDRIPGARGVGAKTAASLLQTYGSLDALLEAGRFAAEADMLRLYRRVATLDPTAPLPPLDDWEPDWAAGAAAARELGLEGLAGRLEEASPVELISHPALAQLHPTGGHPERGERIAALLQRFRRAGGEPCGSRGDRASSRPRIRRKRSKRWRRKPGSTSTPWPGRRRGKRPSLPPAERSRPSTEAASRSFARLGTTPAGARRWGSASSAMRC